MLPEISLRAVTKEDVVRVDGWLKEEIVNSSWYGVDDNGNPVHLGYTPRRVLSSESDSEWDELFGNERPRKIYAIYTPGGEHIGEAQMVIRAPMWEAQLFVLIGRTDMWHQSYGSSALIQLMDIAFYTYGLHRAWVDVPDYNQVAIHMCERLGFQIEGRLRGTHPKGGEWYDSLAMGLLSNEYPRRRARLMGGQEEPPMWTSPVMEGPLDREPREG